MFLRDIPLIAALVRNIRTDTINRSMIGHKITRRLGPIRHEDISLYVDATLDNPSRYISRRCAVPPFYLSRLLYPMFRYFLINRELHLNLLRLVHGQQSIEWTGQFHEGDMITVEMSIDDISDCSAGEMITLKTVVSVDDSPVGLAKTVFIVRKKNHTPKTVTQEPVYEREIFRKTFKTAKNQQMKYARISGDGNFIHTNRLLARLAGLPGTIMHGVCIAAMTSNCLLDEVLNGDMTRMKGISMRFASPVLPGEEITLIGYESGNMNTILFSAFNSSGKPVLKNGEYSFKS